MFLKFFLAILPILWLIIALSVLKIAGHKACLIALAITAVLAAGYWKLSLICTATAGLEGILNALWPICLVIVAALFTYNLTLETGAMELIKKMLASVSVDQRVLLLIIGWGFGNFMEGMAGFGTAVAIPASMLAAIGINPTENLPEIEHKKGAKKLPRPFFGGNEAASLQGIMLSTGQRQLCQGCR